ncbi:Uncharacterised protein [uncultured archaeon]|nr:Uncharacterised protein [uncultured archaeon]
MQPPANEAYLFFVIKYIKKYIPLPAMIKEKRMVRLYDATSPNSKVMGSVNKTNTKLGFME